MIIEKKVRDLKPGDILPNMRNGPQRVVLGTRATAAGPHTMMVAALGLDPLADGFTRITEHKARPEARIGVEVPDLTPAQQHAGELATLLREALALRRLRFSMAEQRARWGAWEPQVDALLNRIAPPQQPPTLEEAIRVLVDVYAKSEDARSITAISALLDRARRAGMLR